MTFLLEDCRNVLFHTAISNLKSVYLICVAGFSTAVEPATSPRESDLGTPKSLRRRKKPKSSGEPSIGSSVSLIDLENSEPSTQANITDESEEKQKTCMDSIREFGASCKVYFEEVANKMIDYFNEISEDYRAIAEQLEKEWTVKYREHLKSAQERRESRDLIESSASAEGSNLGKLGKVSFL